MTTALKELLEDAAVTPPPPPDGLDQALSRARRLRLRTRLAQAAALPVAAAVVFAAVAVAVSSREPSSRLRIVPPASHPTTTTTETTLPGGVALPPVPSTSTTVRPPSVNQTFRDTFFPGSDQPPPPPVFAGAPPPGFRIAFLRDNAVWTMNADGADRRKLLEPGRRPLSWAADRRTLVLETATMGDTWVSVLDVVTGEFRDLVKIPGADVRMVDISPDGRRMVYAYTQEPENENGPWDHLIVSDLDGRNAVELPSHGTFAVWSPDGARIASRCPEGMTSWVCTMKADGTDIRGVASYMSEPFSWSPDGKWLAGWSNNGNAHGVHLVRVDGSEERTVGMRARTDRPVWTPDSKRLIYTRHFVQWPQSQTDADVCLQPPCRWDEGVFSAAIDGSGEVRISDSSWDSYLVAPSR